MAYNQIELYPSPVQSRAYDVRLQNWSSDWDSLENLSFVIYSKEFSGFAEYDYVKLKMSIGANGNPIESDSEFKIVTFSKAAWIGNSNKGLITYDGPVFKNLYIILILYYKGTEIIKTIHRISLYNMLHYLAGWIQQIKQYRMVLG